METTQKNSTARWLRSGDQCLKQQLQAVIGDPACIYFKKMAALRTDEVQHSPEMDFA